MNALKTHLQGLPVYLLGSCLALALDTTILALLAYLGAGLGWAASIGFVSGMGISYAVSVRFAFAHRAVANRRVEFASFVLIGLAGLALTHMMLWCFMVRFELALLPAKAATAAFVFSFNYSLRKWLLFTRSRRTLSSHA
jgi:putative flippase GtrA